MSPLRISIYDQLMRLLHFVVFSPIKISKTSNVLAALRNPFNPPTGNCLKMIPVGIQHAESLRS
ncbi:MAG: hypothetical protein JEZ00_14310 [Anaerolineaceae bacterium]|nr:hypothetical protein [Anaerolineaceae bacterium]